MYIPTSKVNIVTHCLAIAENLYIHTHVCMYVHLHTYIIRLWYALTQKISDKVLSVDN